MALLLGGNSPLTINGGRFVFTIQSKSKIGIYSVIIKDTLRPAVLAFSKPEHAKFIASCVSNNEITYVNPISKNLFSLVSIIDDENPIIVNDCFTQKYDYYQLYDLLRMYNLDLLVCNESTDDSKYLYEGKVYNIHLSFKDKVKMLNVMYQ